MGDEEKKPEEKEETRHGRYDPMEYRWALHEPPKKAWVHKETVTPHPHSRLWGHPEHIKWLKHHNRTHVQPREEMKKQLKEKNEKWDDMDIVHFWVIGAIIVSIMFCCMRRSWKARRSKWPFKVLERNGKFITGAIPTSGKGFDGRKRDFTRMATGGRNIVFCTPHDSPQVWQSSVKPGGQFTQETIDEVFNELKQWLDHEVRVNGNCEINPGLAERVVGLLAVGEPYFWTRKFKIPNVFLQPKYIVIVSCTGEVRVAWYAFITDKIRPNMLSGPYAVKFISKDLNEKGSQFFATTKLYYSVRPSTSTDMLQVIEDHYPAMSRAAVENNWNDLFMA